MVVSRVSVCSRTPPDLASVEPDLCGVVATEQHVGLSGIATTDNARGVNHCVIHRKFPFPAQRIGAFVGILQKVPYAHRQNRRPPDPPQFPIILGGNIHARFRRKHRVQTGSGRVGERTRDIPRRYEPGHLAGDFPSVPSVAGGWQPSCRVPAPREGHLFPSPRRGEPVTRL